MKFRQILPDYTRLMLVSLSFILVMLSINTRVSAADIVTEQNTPESILLLHDDFEDTVPGRLPPAYSKAFGNPGDDYYIVSNERASSGEKSLLYESAGGGQWGFCRRLPLVPASPGEINISFDCYLDGAAANFGLELRENNAKKVCLSFGVKSGRLAFWAERGGRRLLGLPKNKRWLTVKISIPSEATGYAAVSITDQVSGEIVSSNLRCTLPTNGGLLYFVLPPARKEYRFFIDNLRVEMLPQSGILEKIE